MTEVPSEKFIFLHLQTTLQKLHRLVTSDSDIACNLLISSNPKGRTVYLAVKTKWRKKISYHSIVKKSHVYPV
ncbi:hypothetical protein JHK82_044729 [Glycine max]|uniref:Uncharacterized protein n=2 Tax=Glycine subgen. Soja TaxID=1462606 RepID=A0A0R0FP86_SOYBN|nr:hypothetical protein JHK86_045125 [Glycine max]KAG5099677.1 hypothetical protein JHK82_044729 [Glycine max]KAG5108277.1 hypothetical protein JHK84_045184 [Glycine max]RZB60547.1 hypothetical protein D0Y65_043348 [Glycine soja]